MPTVHDSAARERLRRRVEAVSATAEAQWGQMNVAAMFEHLCRSLRMGLGEYPVRPRNRRAFQRFPLKHLLLYVVPFPKNAPTAPELVVAEAGTVESERQSLVELLERAGAAPAEGAGPVHPLFGQLSRREWGVLLHKHIDHHLSQFGA